MIMETVVTVTKLKERLEELRKENKSIGFVPTMGALHQGHLSLIRASKKNNDITVCSIFVNPLQFNNQDDYSSYPVCPEKDIAFLNVTACDILFMPTREEIFPTENNEKFDFGDLGNKLEGAFRPGHFDGVAAVIKRLFEIVGNCRAYFGEKDYQQLLIIRKLTNMLNLPIEIIACPTLREVDGLAMSSRNQLLSEEERNIASKIYDIIYEASERSVSHTPAELKDWVNNQFKEYPIMKVEYFEITDAHTLQSIDNWQSDKEVVSCIAVKIGNVRLIDNIRFFSNFGLN